MSFRFMAVPQNAIRLMKGPLIFPTTNARNPSALPMAFHASLHRRHRRVLEILGGTS